MPEAVREVLKLSKLTMDDIQLVIPHQANLRIIEAAARGLDLSMDKVFVNLDRYGNTSTASIPIATIEALNSGRFKAGDKLVMVGFGAGLTFGAAVVEWSGSACTPACAPSSCACCAGSTPPFGAGPTSISSFNPGAIVREKRTFAPGKPIPSTASRPIQTDLLRFVITL
jgi:hypothetical protein